MGPGSAAHRGACARAARPTHRSLRSRCARGVAIGSPERGCAAQIEVAYLRAFNPAEVQLVWE